MRRLMLLTLIIVGSLFAGAPTIQSWKDQPQADRTAAIADAVQAQVAADAALRDWFTVKPQRKTLSAGVQAIYELSRAGKADLVRITLDQVVRKVVRDRAREIASR